jgi:hypothetical protein
MFSRVIVYAIILLMSIPLWDPINAFAEGHPFVFIVSVVGLTLVIDSAIDAFQDYWDRT